MSNYKAAGQREGLAGKVGAQPGESDERQQHHGEKGPEKPDAGSRGRRCPPQRQDGEGREEMEGEQRPHAGGGWATNPPPRARIWRMRGQCRRHRLELCRKGVEVAAGILHARARCEQIGRGSPASAIIGGRLVFSRLPPSDEDEARGWGRARVRGRPPVARAGSEAESSRSLTYKYYQMDKIHQKQGKTCQEKIRS
jgi:hypothetical protein